MNARLDLSIALLLKGHKQKRMNFLFLKFLICGAASVGEIKTKIWFYQFAHSL